VEPQPDVAHRAGQGGGARHSLPVTIGAGLESGGQVTVRPGDYVLADRSAVIFIARADIEPVLAAAEAIVAKEAAMAQAILAGTPIGEVMGGSYEHMLEKE